MGSELEGHVRTSSPKVVAPFTSRGTSPVAGLSSPVNEKVLLKKILRQFLSQHLQIGLGCEGEREEGEERWKS